MKTPSDIKDGPVLVLEDFHVLRDVLEERLEAEGILTLSYSDPAKAIDDVRGG